MMMAIYRIRVELDGTVLAMSYGVTCILHKVHKQEER